jgi:hypothetical protein
MPSELDFTETNIAELLKEWKDEDAIWVGMGRDVVTPLWVFVVWYVWGGIFGRSYSP